jgi:hypothetical protein
VLIALHHAGPSAVGHLDGNDLVDEAAGGMRIGPALL